MTDVVVLVQSERKQVPVFVDGPGRWLDAGATLAGTEQGAFPVPPTLCFPKHLRHEPRIFVGTTAKRSIQGGAFRALADADLHMSCLIVG